MDVSIQKGLIGSFLFIPIFICQKTQEFMAAIVWFVLVWPLFPFFKNSAPDAPIKYSVKFDNPLHRFLFKIFRVTLRFHVWIGGMKSVQNIYPRLMTWNQKIPLIGYLEGKTIQTLETLGLPKEDGSRPWDAIWISRSRPNGQFHLTGRVIEPKKETVEINAVWTTGKDSGKTFKITKNYAVYRYKEKDNSEDHPTHIYMPPRFLVFTIEALLSSSAILSFLSLTKDGWEMLSSALSFAKPLFDNFLETVGSIFS